MTDLRICLAELPKDLPQIYQIRYLVFQIEQGVEPELEFDGKDDTSTHFLVYLEEKPVGTARVRFLQPHIAKVERVAVLSKLRGKGIGYRLMEYILDYLATQNVREVCMHAQTPVRMFYEKLGFEAEGEVFEEAGIPHITMRKLLHELN